MNMDQIFKKIEYLFERYSLERRAMTQPYLLDVVEEFVQGYQYNAKDDLIRETLMEHVGSTPVLATALYPYINDPAVNLGDSLTMLAIHDIGELEVHDQNTFTKKSDHKKIEYSAAIKLLDPYYHTIYNDVETQSSQTAKYAKAIDKITPDIFDYLNKPAYTVARFKQLVGIDKQDIIPTIIKHKRPYMLWNPFMIEFHDYLMKKLAEKLDQV